VAVVLAFRVAIALTPVAVRVAKYADGPGADDLTRVPKSLWDRLTDPGESDADLTDALSDSVGYTANVTTFSGSFSTRKLQVSVSYGTEDVRVNTHHFLKVASGSPVDTWVAADFVILEDAYDTFWAAMKDTLPPAYTLATLKWYKAGPADAPPQEPVRSVDRSVVGTSIYSSVPPQCCATVTEKTAAGNAWGRFYFPAPGANGAYYNGTGRFVSTYQTQLANAIDAWYETALAANLLPVVYSAAKPVRPTASGGTLAATVARALTIDQLQIDDIPDVIRSRRHNAPTLKLQRTVGA
jgi:hypothetical protein